MSRAVAMPWPVSMRLTLLGEHRRRSATCSTVRPLPVRSARSRTPSSLRRTVGLRTSGNGGRLLSQEQLAIAEPSDPDLWDCADHTCEMHLKMALARWHCSMHY